MCSDKPVSSRGRAETKHVVLSDALKALFSWMSDSEVALLMNDVQFGRVSIPIIIEMCTSEEDKRQEAAGRR
jgi:uncharacterized protein (UPF0216 family)